MENTVILPNRYLHDINLSLEGKGLLTTIYNLIQQETEFEFTGECLSQYSSDTPQEIDKFLQEIIDSGYIGVITKNDVQVFTVYENPKENRKFKEN